MSNNIGSVLSTKEYDKSKPAFTCPLCGVHRRLQADMYMHCKYEHTDDSESNEDRREQVYSMAGSSSNF